MNSLSIRMWLIAAICLLAGGVLAPAAESGRPSRTRPLATLPGEPGGTTAKRKALGDNEGEVKGKERNYGELVKGLVSPNEPPQIDIEAGGPRAFPPDYDWKAQDRIEKNRRMLYEHCEEALRSLIEGSTDTRYSLTWQSDSYAGNSCVGEACLEIVASHLEVYRESMSSLGSKTRYYSYRFVPRINSAIGKQVTAEKKKEIEEWWRGRRGKSLLELQIEALDWAIEKRKQERDGLASGAPDRRDATKEIKRLIAARNKLKKAGKCLPPRHIPPSVRGLGRK